MFSGDKFLYQRKYLHILGVSIVMLFRFQKEGKKPFQYDNCKSTFAFKCKFKTYPLSVHDQKMPFKSDLFSYSASQMCDFRRLNELIGSSTSGIWDLEFEIWNNLVI